jgi:probable HAF family extracellular repeat protein
MNLRTACCGAVVVALCVFGQEQFVSTQAPAAGPYFIDDLGTLGGAESRAFGISEAADAAGSAQRADGTTHAFFSSGGTLADLGTLGGASSVATGVNQSGAVAGHSLSSLANQKAFLWTKAGGMVSLRTLGGSASDAAAINDAGDIVGSAQTTGNTARRAFIYHNGVMTKVGDTFGGTDSAATAINQYGEVAGWAATAGNASKRAFWYTGGVTTNLGTLGGASLATGLNSGAEIVGHSVTASGARHAFLYRDGSMKDLGTLGGANSEATGINDWSFVIGTSDVGGGGTHAFSYSNGTMTDLNSLLPAGSGWILEAATGVNDSGEIAGFGRVNGQRHAFRLRPSVSLDLREGGILSQEETNLPRDGVQVGRNVTFINSIAVGDADATARNIVLTATVEGPIEIVGVRRYRELGPCEVEGKIVTCQIPALGPVRGHAIFEEEVWVTVRVTGPGLFSLTARATADNLRPGNVETMRQDNRGIALLDFTLSATTAAGGKAVSARATLTSLAPSGGAVVSIVSSNPEVAPIPSRLVVEPPLAYRTFNIVPAVVSQPTTVTISATYGLVTISRTLTVVPPALSTVSLTRSTIIGSCQTATAKVTLTGNAPSSGASVALATTTAGVNSPSSVMVPAGATSASITVTTRAVSTINNGTFTASYGGVSKGLSLSVRPIYVTGVVLTPSTVPGGGTASGQATIECAAPSGGMTVALSSTNAAVATPTTTSIVLPAGATKGGFSVRTQRPAGTTTVSIRAAAHAVTKSASLTVTP